MLALAGTPTLADETTVTPIDDVFERGCGDDNGTDRCDAEIQRIMRELYEWEPAEALLEQGVQFRRFMMVDGYGRDVLGLTFERRPGSSPTVIVDVPKDERGEGNFVRNVPASLTAVVGLEQWNRALDTTLFVDQQLAREQASDEDEKGDSITICLHGWFTVIEAGDPAIRGSNSSAKAKLRSDAEGSCAKGLSMPAAFELANVAYGVLPECHQLDEADYRNRMTLLAECKRLGGDRLAAARAVKTVRRFEDVLYQSIRKQQDLSLASFFSYDRKEMAAELERRMRGATADFGSPHATDGLHAHVIGTLSPADQPPEEENAYRYADIRLDLRNRGRNWTIESYEISNIKTVAYEVEDTEDE